MSEMHPVESAATKHDGDPAVGYVYRPAVVFADGALFLRPAVVIRSAGATVSVDYAAYDRFISTEEGLGEHFMRVAENHLEHSGTGLGFHGLFIPLSGNDGLIDVQVPHTHEQVPCISDLAALSDKGVYRSDLERDRVDCATGLFGNRSFLYTHFSEGEDAFTDSLLRCCRRMGEGTSEIYRPLIREEGSGEIYFEFGENISSVLNGTALLHPGLVRPTSRWNGLICDSEGICTNLAALKTGLVNNGVVCSKRLESIGKRPGVNSSLDLLLHVDQFQYRDRTFDEIPINCAHGNRISVFSPFEADLTEDGTEVRLSYLGKLLRCRNGEPLHFRFYSQSNKAQLGVTSSGVPIDTMAFIATDRVRFQHNDRCDFAIAGKGCRFCEFTCSGKNRPAGFGTGDILEAIDQVLDNASPYTEYVPGTSAGKVFVDHVLIGGGSLLNTGLFRNTVLAMCERISSKNRRYPIYLMSYPLKDTEMMEEFRRAGVTEVAFNIEFFSERFAKRYMPGKGTMTRTEYLESLSKAVEVWGPEGNVRSALIIGVEPLSETLKGVIALADLGVSPMLSIFRPTTGTEMEHIMPPCSEALYDLFIEAHRICRDRNRSLAPTCLYCQNNVLALPFELLDRTAP